ncbi:MAG TPA: helix-turn-helix transcriptional regulator [Sphingomonadales bacterium]|nr:helix-turn-helix transcriptional regulator [Sphingomonadales bacterium]
MTPFGIKLRALREEKGITQRQLAKALGVSAPYLSALERGKRGRPSWALVQKIITYFGAIWDDAEEIEALARLSHPKITIDTSKLSPEATEVANRLSATIHRLDERQLKKILKTLNELLEH